MSGEPLFLADDDSGRIAAYLRVLRGLPAEPRWVLVGGLAVNIRLGRVHRATNDVDTVSEDQPRLVELLVANSEDATKLSAGKVRLRDPEVEVDG